MRRLLGLFGFAVLSWLLVGVVALLVAGCGGGPPSHPPPRARTVRICSGTTDTCHLVDLDKLYRLAKVAPQTGCRIPDVSDYQGFVDWAAAKSVICGGITKMGEGGGFAGGTQFFRNWSQLRQLGLWHTAYWFVRSSASCATQATLIIGRLHAVSYETDPLAGPMQLDEEVPGSNLTACLDHAIFVVFHRHAMVYTGPGTWPGGDHAGVALWEATYGSHFVPVWNPVLLWQCTDGVFGCVTRIPGIGFGDVSVDRGITKLTRAPAPPPRPHCFGAHWHHTSTCRRVRFGYHRARLDVAKLDRLLAAHRCPQCGGWVAALKRSQQTLADLQRKFA